MAGPAPKTQSWTARENLQKDQLVLIVAGQVQVGNTGLVPKLAEGGALRDPHSLNLELTIADSDHPGTDVEVWMAASLQKNVGADEFHDVVVRWDGTKIAQFPVVDDSEHSALMDKRSKAQNTVAKVATGKPAAKKAVKQAAKKAVRKAAPKKAAPRAVGGWAKAAKKKVAKKTAKTTAKTTAKKATKKAPKTPAKKARKTKSRRR